ncbi:MAG TPA: hypothetical protein V6D46_10940, partial [Coleofasciculaceae cyanobacterium]
MDCLEPPGFVVRIFGLFAQMIEHRMGHLFGQFSVVICKPKYHPNTVVSMSIFERPNYQAGESE